MLRETSNVSQATRPEVAMFTVPVVPPRAAKEDVVGIGFGIADVEEAARDVDGRGSRGVAVGTLEQADDIDRSAGLVDCSDGASRGRPLLRRAEIVSVPPTMLRVAGVPVPTPMRELTAELQASWGRTGARAESEGCRLEYPTPLGW